MNTLNFNEKFCICTRSGFISNFRIIHDRGRRGYSYEMDWDAASRTYFSAEDARKVQKSLRSAAAIYDESSFVEQLARDFYNGLCTLQEVYARYNPISLMG